MSFRATQKEKSKCRFKAAIERLKAGNVISKELIGKKNLKINRFNVEIEAGMSKGSLRHYPEIVDQINEITCKANTEPCKSDILDIKIDRLKIKLKHSNSLRKKYFDELTTIEDAMKVQLASHHELVVALFDKIPESERNELFLKNLGNNVLNFTKK
ncbi:hypothetical protein [Aeromonas jandaei]|uniref:hypothetical protein n=1 Tax=Aeromonas jandaei TaxID=650 RepID=UPI002B05B5A4|nr:hypothetical protein [Aeromonas jandaei]